MPASVSPAGLSSFHAASNLYCILINHLFKHSGGDKKHIKGNMQQQLIDAWFSLAPLGCIFCRRVKRFPSHWHLFFHFEINPCPPLAILLRATHKFRDTRRLFVRAVFVHCFFQPLMAGVGPGDTSYFIYGDPLLHAGVTPISDVITI